MRLEEVRLADMKYDDEQLTYYYTCPCGDEFEITLEELHDGEVGQLQHPGHIRTLSAV